MTDPDLALERIRKATFALTAGGSIGALAWRGWTWGAGFALGSVVSWLNYSFLKQMAYAIGRPQTRKRLLVFVGIRYLLFGGGAYVIVRFSKISMPAVLLGLFVSVAAVIVEIVIQLAYAPRT
jgi:hypothetical protein